MAETPFPIASQIFGSSGSANQRPSLVFREFKRRLEHHLPELIGEANEQLDLSGELAFPTIGSFRLAPAVIDEKCLNQVLIAISYKNEAIAPRIFKGVLSVAVFYIGEESETEEQALMYFDLGALIQEAMAPYINRVRDEKDRRCWNQCTPADITMLPEEWVGYSGVSVTFEAHQHPGTGTKAWT